jgi:hypothetical protein
VNDRADLRIGTIELGVDGELPGKSVRRREIVVRGVETDAMNVVKCRELNTWISKRPATHQDVVGPRNSGTDVASDLADTSGDSEDLAGRD